MSRENPQKPWFFDSRDSKASFKFQKPTPKNKNDLTVSFTIQGFFTCKNLETHICQKGVHALHKQLLVFYGDSLQNSPQMILDLAQSRMKITPPVQGIQTHVITLQKDGNTFEMQFTEKAQADQWVAQLKSVCIIDTFHEDYKAIKMIGKGGFAKVFLIESKIDGNSYAAKAFVKETLMNNTKTNTRAALINEIDIMRELSHDNLIRLYEVHETDKSIYLVMELIQGKPLQEVLRRSTFQDDNSDARITEMIYSIVDALSYIASKGMMHRDLKPANILVDKSGKIKIIDFGLATYIKATDYIFKKCGTPGYIAPEVFEYDEKVPSTYYNDRCDIFSAGCIMYYMLFGKPLIQANDASKALALNRDFDDLEIIYLVKKELANPGSKINKEGLNLLLLMLKSNPKTRPRAEDILNHPYFTNIVNKDNLSSESREAFHESMVKITQFDSHNSQNGVANSLTPYKSRFMVKNSFYVDVGNPEMNGNVGTISNTSMNNSLALKRGETNSNPNSISTFAKKDAIKEQFTGQKTKGLSRSFKVQNTNQTFLKAAIFNNMHKHENGEEEVKKSEFSLMKQNRSQSDDPIRDDSSANSNASNADIDSSELNDLDNENCDVDLERLRDFNPKKHPHHSRKGEKKGARRVSRSVHPKINAN